MPVPRKRLRISIVGPGRVGSTLAILLKRRGHAIVSVVGKSAGSAKILARKVQSRVASSQVMSLPGETTCLVLALPEQEISQTVQDIAGLDHLRFKNLAAFHTSGALTSDLLAPLAQKGATVFSLHPIQTFAQHLSPHDQVSLMKNVWYGWEGPAASTSMARFIVRELGGKVLSVPKEKKILYHLACVFASNYPVVLVGAVEELAGGIGKEGTLPFRRLTETSIENAFSAGSSRSLTGPLTRGSVDVLEQHIRVLGTSRAELLNLYRSLGLFALGLAKKQGKLSEEQIHHLGNILAGNRDR